MPDQQDRRILLLDDGDDAVASEFAAILSADGYSLLVAADLPASLPILPNTGIALCRCRALAIQDCLHVIQHWLSIDPDLAILVVAEGMAIEDAAALMRAGARDLLSLPLRNPQALKAAISAAMVWREERRAHRDALEATAATRTEQEQRLRTLSEDEEAGRRVQQKILPPTPHDFGWCRVEHRVVPSLYLSGDFLDYFEIGDRCLAFYLADVSGHGASSAFVTMLLKTLGNRARRELRRDTVGTGPWRPSLLLDRINRELLSLGLGKHVAMLAGVVDLRTRELSYAVAGQYPQLIVYDGNCAQYVEGTGMPVGLFDAALYEDRIHALPAGFTLVLLSDGVFELMGSASLADKETSLLDMVGNGALDVDALSRALALDGRRDIPDDVAMLVIREAAAETGA